MYCEILDTVKLGGDGCRRNQLVTDLPEAEFVVLDDDLQNRWRPNFALDESLREWVLDELLQGPPQGARSVTSVAAGLFENPCRGFRVQSQGEVFLGESLVHLFDHQLDNPPQVVVGQSLEDDLRKVAGKGVEPEAGEELEKEGQMPKGQCSSPGLPHASDELPFPL